MNTAPPIILFFFSESFKDSVLDFYAIRRRLSPKNWKSNFFFAQSEAQPSERYSAGDFGEGQS